MKNGKESTLRKCIGKTCVLVLLPTYDGAQFVEEQIKSILEQDGNVCIHLLIRDDKSWDMTCNIVEKLNNERITLKRGNTHKGYQHNVQSLLRAAQSSDFDVFSLADQDDVWFKFKIHESVSMLLEKNSNAICTNRIMVKLNGEVALQIESGSSRFLKSRELVFRNHCFGSTLVFNRDALDRLMEHLRFDIPHIDLQIGLILARNNQIFFLKEPTMYYRLHESNLVGANFGERNYIRKVLNLIERVYICIQLNRRISIH